MGGQQRTPPGRMVLLTISVALLSIFASPGSCQEIPAESGSGNGSNHSVMASNTYVYSSNQTAESGSNHSAMASNTYVYSSNQQRNQDQDMALTTVQWPQITVVC